MSEIVDPLYHPDFQVFLANIKKASEMTKVSIPDVLSAYSVWKGFRSADTAIQSGKDALSQVIAYFAKAETKVEPGEEWKEGKEGH